MILLLGYALPLGGAANVLAARGVDITGGGTIPVGAPAGAGFHVWQGELREDKLVGGWRRATARDLEEFGMPLSTPTAREGWCCAMRQKFLVQIVAENQQVPAPADMVDFILAWEPKITLMLKFCPFCGGSLENGKSNLRTVG